MRSSAFSTVAMLAMASISSASQYVPSVQDYPVPWEMRPTKGRRFGNNRAERTSKRRAANKAARKARAKQRKRGRG